MNWPDFSRRSSEPELLDQPILDQSALNQNLAELETINRLLGGHHTTISGLVKLMKNHPQSSYSIADIGCGGGDNLRVLEKYFKRAGIHVRLLGIDISQQVLSYASSRLPSDTTIRLVHADVFEFLNSAESIDIMVMSLTNHHFSNEDNVNLMKLMARKAKIGFVINDLHRHPLAWLGIWILTRLIPSSYLLKHDSVLSVLRSFTRQELNQIISEAGLSQVSVEWRWAFRWLVQYGREWSPTPDPST